MKAFEFPHRPSGDCTIDMLAYGVERRGVELTVVVHPSRDHWVEHPREIFERFVALQLNRQLRISWRTDCAAPGDIAGVKFVKIRPCRSKLRLGRKL